MPDISTTNLLYNLRSRWPLESESFTDDQLVALYKQFAQSDEYGDNDEKFPLWLEEGPL